MAVATGAPDPNKLLTKGEVAAYCRNDVRTINRWMERGKLRFVRLPGGHLRFRFKDVLDALDGSFESPGCDNDPSMG